MGGITVIPGGRNGGMGRTGSLSKQIIFPSGDRSPEHTGTVRGHLNLIKLYQLVVNPRMFYSHW